MFILSEEQCITCGTCVEACHNKALQIIDGALVHDPDKCNWCGHCLALCPRDAIMIDGDGYDVEDVEEFNMLTRPTPQQIRRQIMMRRSIRRFNEEFGIPVFDSDAEAKACYAEPAVRTAVRNAFGPEVVLPDGKVNVVI